MACRSCGGSKPSTPRPSGTPIQPRTHGKYIPGPRITIPKQK